MDRLEDAAGDEIRIGGGVRTTVLEVTLVVVVDEAVGDTDRGAAVGETVAELVDRLRLVETRETEMVFRTVDGDVLVAEFVEGGHEFLKVGFAALLTHELGGEVGVHTGAVPIERLLEGSEDRFAAELDVDPVSLGEADQQIAGDPHLIGGTLRALAENLEFPLALRHFGVDALEVDAGIEMQQVALV